MERKQLEGTEGTRNSIPVNFALEVMELLAVGIPGMLEKTFLLGLDSLDRDLPV